MDPSRTQRYGKHYYRNNYVPSSSRQVLEDRLHPPGISTSSNSSWTFSNSHDIPKHKKGRLCGIFLIGAVMVVALAVIAIGGLAFYIGGHSTDAEQNVRKYQTKDNIGAKRQYSNRETESAKTTDSQYSSKVTATTQTLLETSTTAEPNQTKSVHSGAILGLSDTMKLLNDEVKNKKKDEVTTTLAETVTEIVESLTEVTYSTEESVVPYLTTRNVEILPKNSEKPSVVEVENLSEDRKFIVFEDGSTKTEAIQNGHARPTFSGPLLSPIATTMSTGLFPPHRDYADEPWRPIIPSYREPVRIEHPQEQFTEKVFQHRYGPTEEYIIDNDSPITFSRKSYEQNLGISSEFKGVENKLRKTQSSRISDELAVKYKDLITKEGLEASGGGMPEVIVRSDDVMPSPPRKSADVIILSEVSTASTLSAFYNADKIVKTSEKAPKEEEYTFKVPHNVQSYTFTEATSQASPPEVTTRQTKITPVTFKTILNVTSKKTAEKNSTVAASVILYESEVVPVKNEAESVAREETVTTERLKTITRSEAPTIAKTVATERLKTTEKSDILTTVEASSQSTTEVTSTTAAVHHNNKKIIKNPFADDSRSSSSSFNFGIPDLPILKQFQNLDTFLKTPGNGSATKNATDMSKYFVRNDENPDQIITRFPVRTRATTPRSYKRDDPSPVEISTTETTPKSIPLLKKPVVIRGEVEVVSGSLKQGITRATTEIPKLITLLPVRSNVNMMKPLRPRPKSNISSTIVITDRRKAKMNSKFSAKESATNQTQTPKLYYSVPFREALTKGDSQWVYYSSSDSRDVPDKDEKLFIVTPEPKSSENNNASTEEVFSHFPENLSGLPLYNTIEALLNVDNRDRGANRNNYATGGKTRESPQEPTKKNTSEIVNQIVKVVDNVVISSGDLPKIIVKVNQTMVNKTTSE